MGGINDGMGKSISVPFCNGRLFMFTMAFAFTIALAFLAASFKAACVDSDTQRLAGGFIS